jgi:THO complex subunit 3
MYQDDVVCLMDTRMWSIVHQAKHDTEINELTWSPDGELFYVTTGRGQVRVYQSPSMEHAFSIKTNSANCYCIDFDPQGRYFAVGGADALVSLWDTQDAICLQTYPELEWPIRALSFSHDDVYLASASEDLFIEIVCLRNAWLITHLI